MVNRKAVFLSGEYTLTSAVLGVASSLINDNVPVLPAVIVSVGCPKAIKAASSLL